jgi:hypothetical protein
MQRRISYNEALELADKPPLVLLEGPEAIAGSITIPEIESFGATIHVEVLGMVANPNYRPTQTSDRVVVRVPTGPTTTRFLSEYRLSATDGPLECLNCGSNQMAGEDIRACPYCKAAALSQDENWIS